MLASYLLSRTLIPTMVHYLLRAEVKLYHSIRSLDSDAAGIRRIVAWHATNVATSKMGGNLAYSGSTRAHAEVMPRGGGTGIFWVIHGRFNGQFERCGSDTGGAGVLAASPRPGCGGFWSICAGSLLLCLWSAATFSPMSIPARCGCTYVRRWGRVLRKPRSCLGRLKTRSGALSLLATSIHCSITLACQTEGSIWPLAMPL